MDESKAIARFYPAFAFIMMERFLTSSSVFGETAITEARADFGSNCMLDAAVERLDFLKPYLFRGRYAYERKE